MNRTLALAGVLTSLVASPAAAQEDRRSLRGVEAVEAALAAHPGYRSTLEELRRARARVRSEGARFVPQLHLEGALQIGNQPSLTQDSVAFPYSETVSLSAELAHTFDTGTNVAVRLAGSRSFRRIVINIPGTSAVLPFGPGYGLDLTLSVAQPFLRGFGTDVVRSQESIARLDRTTAERALRRRASDLVRDTLVAYAELWVVEEAARIESLAKETAERQLAELEARVEIGVLTPVELLPLRTRIASLDEALALREADRRGRASVLATLLGLPLGTELHAEEAPPPLAGVLTDSDALARAVMESPELAELDAQIESARLQSRFAVEPLRPRLDAQAQLGIHGLGNDDVPEALAQVGRFAAVTATLGVVGEAPLDGTRLEAEAERAGHAVRALEERREEARATIEQRVYILLEQRRAADRRLALAATTVQLAEASLEAERARTEIGTRTPSEVLLAEEELRSARLRERRAEGDRVVAEIQLRAFTGDLLDGVELPEP